MRDGIVNERARFWLFLTMGIYLAGIAFAALIAIYQVYYEKA